MASESAESYDLMTRSLYPECYSSLHSMYHICLTVSLLLMEIWYIGYIAFFLSQTLTRLLLSRLKLQPSNAVLSRTVSYISFSFSLSLVDSLLFRHLSCLLAISHRSMTDPLNLFSTTRGQIVTITMVGTRKTPSGETTVTLDGSPVVGPVDDEYDTIDIICRFPTFAGSFLCWFLSRRAALRPLIRTKLTPALTFLVPSAYKHPFQSSLLHRMHLRARDHRPPLQAWTLTESRTFHTSGGSGYTQGTSSASTRSSRERLSMELG